MARIMATSSRETGRRGETVGICEWSARRVVHRRQAALLAYLGALRVAPRYRHRVGVLKGGFRGGAGSALHHQRATAVCADRDRSRESVAACACSAPSLPGMPTYHPLEAFSTFAHAAALRFRLRSSLNASAAEDDLPAIAVCLARSYRDLQFAPVWRAASLGDPDRVETSTPRDFHRRPPRAEESQHASRYGTKSVFKQTMVCGYAGWLRWASAVLVNLVAPLFAMPRGCRVRPASRRSLSVASCSRATTIQELFSGADRRRAR